jgi:hypothetical protein
MQIINQSTHTHKHEGRHTDILKGLCVFGLCLFEISKGFDLMQSHQLVMSWLSSLVPISFLTRHGLMVQW